MNCYIASVLAEVSLSSVLSVSLQELNPTYTASTVVDFLLENDQVPNRDVQRGYYRGKSAVIRGKTAVTGTIFVKLPR